MRRGALRSFSQAIPAALLGAAGIAACGGAQTDSGSAPQMPPANAPASTPDVGPTEPAFEVLDMQPLAERIRARAAASPRGLMVNLWATWCAPCLAEMPDLHAFAASAELPVWTISVDLAMPDEIQSPEGIAAFAGERSITLPTVLFRGELADLVEHYDLPAGVVPQTLVFSSAGELVASHIGEADAVRFAELAAATE